MKSSDNGLVSDRDLCKVVRLPYFPGHAGNRKGLFFVIPKLIRHVHFIKYFPYYLSH